MTVGEISLTVSLGVLSSIAATLITAALAPRVRAYRDYVAVLVASCMVSLFVGFYVGGAGSTCGLNCQPTPSPSITLNPGGTRVPGLVPVTPPPSPSPDPGPSLDPTSEDRIVPANSNQGVTYTAPKAGQLHVRYLAGAYRVSPPGEAQPEFGPWRTAVFLFTDGVVRFSGPTLETGARTALPIGDPAPHSFATEGEAIIAASAEDPLFPIPLAAGQTIVFVTVDDQTRYKDNLGAVTLRLEFRPSP
jgi:hypothetical protein